MTTPTIRALMTLALLGATTTACTDDETTAPATDAGATTDAGTATDAGVSTDATPSLKTGALGLAVVHSDYKSAAVSLLDPATGAVLKDACLSSGTKPPQLSAALSGDATLPSAPQTAHELLVIDKKQNTLIWMDPMTCTVLRQMQIEPTFDANPYDVIDLGDGRAYVTRYNPNAKKPEEGSDIQIIDPKQGKSLGTINLRAQTTAPILPRPGRGLLIKGKVYVALESLSADFMSAGPGRIVIIDPATDKVTGTLDLPTLHNCGGISYQKAESALVVTCGGSFSDGAKQIDFSGVAWFDLTSSSSAPTRIIAAKDFGRAVSYSQVAVLDRATAFTSSLGDFMGPGKETIWRFGFAGAAPIKVMEATGSAVLSLFLDPDGRRLYVGDAADKTPKVATFKIESDGSTTAGPTVITNPSTNLPPRYFGWY